MKTPWEDLEDIARGLQTDLDSIRNDVELMLDQPTAELGGFPPSLEGIKRAVLRAKVATEELRIRALRSLPKLER